MYAVHLKLFYARSSTVITNMRIFTGVQWEGDCEFIYETVSCYKNWLSGHVEASGELSRVDKNVQWVYCDYTYMKHLLNDVEGDMQLKDVVDWSQYGFEDEEGEDCALWMGSAGSHTVCHQDSYGFNVVLQVGRWIVATVVNRIS